MKGWLLCSIKSFCFLSLSFLSCVSFLLLMDNVRLHFLLAIGLPFGVLLLTIHSICMQVLLPHNTAAPTCPTLESGESKCMNLYLKVNTLGQFE